MRSGKAVWLALALILAPLPVAGDEKRNEALRALRDQAGAIQSWVESAERPAWLDANPHDGARAAGEALGRQQHERFREGLPVFSACRDLGQLCPPATAEAASALPNAVPTGRKGTVSIEGSDQDLNATALHADDIRLTVLVSRSLGAAQIKEIFAFAADTPRTRASRLLGVLK